MTKFILPDFYIDKDKTWFINEIDLYNNVNNISLDNDSLNNIIINISYLNNLPNGEYYIKSILYTILCLIKLNDINDIKFPFGIDNKNGMPNKGYEFYKETGIYHVHITEYNNGIVLIWYVIKQDEDDDIYEIKFKHCSPHPTHIIYNSFIKDIKNEENTYNVYKKEYLIGSIFEKRINMYDDFIKKLK